MRTILGLSAWYHDAAAALVVDGEVVAAVQEERLSRVKHDARFPARAVAACLAQAGMRLEDVDLVALHEKPLLKLDRLLETYLATAPLSLRSFLRSMPSWLRRKAHPARELAKALGPAYTKRFVFAEHHVSHAAAAFFPSPFEEAAVLTLDGVGEWATASLGVGKGASLTLLEEQRFPHSLGLLYSAFTALCGFAINDGEYKLMGLAPYGTPRWRDLLLERVVDVKPDGSLKLDMRWFGFDRGLAMTTPALHRLLGVEPRRGDEPLTEAHMDLAASIQAVTEEVMLRAARHALKRTGQKRLCLGGGVALNCVGNGRILREAGVEALWVQPAAGDAGSALGAALWTWHGLLGKPRTARTTDAMHGARLGPRHDAVDARRLLERVGARHERFEDRARLHDRVASLLDEGKVVAWYEGALEYGPRALGGRSILADARRPDMQSRVNLMVKQRESFRPFAPAVLAEEADRWFDLRGHASPYMLVVAPVASERRLPEPTGTTAPGFARLSVPRSTVPAVTHVDGSARVQTVDRERAPAFHALLSAFHRRTGCPVLVNTSFNVKDEPIVATPEDAWRTYLATGIDALVLEDCLVVEKPAHALAAAPAARADTLDVLQGAEGAEAPPAPTPLALWLFVLAPLVVLGTIAFLVWRSTGARTGPLVLGVVGLLGTLALLALPAQRPAAWRAWQRIAAPIAHVVGTLLLTLVYLLVVTPVGLVRRLFARDPLDRRVDRAAPTAWRARPPAPPPEDAFRPS